MPLPLTVSCSSKIQIGFTFLVPADLGTPGKRAVKRVCVCVCYQTLIYTNKTESVASIKVNYIRFTFPAPPCTLAVSQTLHPKQTVPAHEINGLHINKAPKNLIDSVTTVTQSSI